MSAQHTPGPWKYRRMRTHFAIEAQNGVRVAEVRYHSRPDGSTSEVEAAAIASLPELIEAAEGLLHEVGFDRFVASTVSSERLRAAIAAARGQA